ncbi:MAG: hypothetical protein ACT4PV_13085 [Planctomycetaceae bacterium]
MTTLATLLLGEILGALLSTRACVALVAAAILFGRRAVIRFLGRTDAPGR